MSNRIPVDSEEGQRRSDALRNHPVAVAATILGMKYTVLRGWAERNGVPITTSAEARDVLMISELGPWPATLNEIRRRWPGTFPAASGVWVWATRQVAVGNLVKKSRGVYALSSKMKKAVVAGE